MLKKFLASGAVIAGFAGLGFAAPAHATTPWPQPENHSNVSSQNDNVFVCGNKTIGDITAAVITLAPVTTADNDSTDCGVRNNQNN
ncbi:hypothetical protein [Streptosporangium sp. KLBMP 9127]|nr:hypothetical protein [Streptosporangium sp. KLBMP 9127]